jgi:hypothetical protein
MKSPLSLVLMFGIATGVAWSAASPHIIRDGEAIVGGFGKCATTTSNNSCGTASGGMSGCTGTFTNCAQTAADPGICELTDLFGCSGTSQDSCDFDEPQFECK